MVTGSLPLGTAVPTAGPPPKRAKASPAQSAGGRGDLEALRTKLAGLAKTSSPKPTPPAPPKELPKPDAVEVEDGDDECPSADDEEQESQE